MKLKLLTAVAALVACSGAWAEPVELVCVRETDNGQDIVGVRFDEDTGDVRVGKAAEDLKDCKKEKSITEAEINCDMGRDFTGYKRLWSVDRFLGVLTISLVNAFDKSFPYNFDCAVKAEKQKF